MTELETTQTQSAPIHYWVISIVGALYFFAGSIQAALMQLEAPFLIERLSAEEVELLQSYTALFYVLLWPVVLGGLAGCGLLLRRRSSASIGFLVSVAFAAIHEVQVNVSHDMSMVPLSERILAPVTLIGIPAIYLWYTRSMQRRGLLD